MPKTPCRGCSKAKRKTQLNKNGYCKSCARKFEKGNIKDFEHKIRLLPQRKTLDEIRALMTMENLEKIENPQYKKWIGKKFRIFYPNIMERLHGPEKEESEPVQEKAQRKKKK